MGRERAEGVPNLQREFSQAQRGRRAKRALSNNQKDGLTTILYRRLIDRRDQVQFSSISSAV